MTLIRYPVVTITGLALLLLVLGFWPVARQTDSNVTASVPEAGITLTLTLDAPQQVRWGQSETLNLATRLDRIAGSTPATPPTTLTVVTLNSTCLSLDPPGEVLQTDPFGQTRQWQWQLRQDDAASGPCEVDVVVQLRRDSADRIVWVKMLLMETASVLGMPAPVAQVAGLVGSVLGLSLLAGIQLRLRHRP